jgi:hypothetical protein
MRDASAAAPLENSMPRSQTVSGTRFAPNRKGPATCAEMCRAAAPVNWSSCVKHQDLLTIRPPRSRLSLASASTAATVAAVSLTAVAARAEPLLHIAERVRSVALAELTRLLG